MEEKEIIPYNTPEDGVAPTITTMYARLGTNNLTPGEYGGAMGIMEVKSCASRKRGDEHKIEIRKDDVANCVTSIDTDSMVQEPLKIPQATKQGYIECPIGGVFDASYPNSELRRGRVQENGEVSPALTTNSEGAILRYEEVEPQVLTPLRTEEGRQLRKQGIEKFSNRALYPREDGVSNCVTSVTKDNLLQEPSTLCLNYFDENGKQRSLQDRIYDSSGLSTAITTSFHPNIAEAAKELKEIAQRGRNCDVDVTINEDGSLRPYNKNTKAKDGISEFVTQHEDNSANTVTTSHGGNVYGKATWYRIRKLTEREVFRLMDVNEEDIDKIQAAGISKTAMYKLAGNSIVCSCLYHIFRKLFCETRCEDQQLSLFDFDD